MNKTLLNKISKITSVGFAMFAMLFGAGNVIFPLVLGRDIGDKLWFGLAGFCIMAVLVPLIGLIAVMLCDGEYEKFLGKMGRIPGFITALFCMMLLGPLVFTPRCIAISHASISTYMPQFTLFFYSIFTAGIIFLCTIRQNGVLDLLGYVLGPLKFLLLFIAIIAGFFFPQAFMEFPITSFKAMQTGLTAGYWTGDLLGTIFFSGLIYAGLKKGMTGPTNYRQLAIMGLQAGSVGALLLGLVYAGFCVVAAFNGPSLQGIPDGNIFSFLVPFLLGPIGGVLANVTVALSTMTTAIALTAVTASFFQQYVFCNRISYKYALMITIAATTMMSNLGFAGIMKFAGPAIFTIYPALIVLAITSSMQVLFGFKWVKTPVYAAFCLTLIVNHWEDMQRFTSKKDVSAHIYNILDKHRITYDIDAHSVDPTSDITSKPITGITECIQQISAFVVNEKPINMLAVGFPFKSPNHEKKTIGDLPDMAERKSFEYLQDMLNEMKAVYAPGVCLTVFCDGIPFAEFLGVSPQHVVAYEKALQQLVADLPDIKLITSAELMYKHALEHFNDINTMIDVYGPTNDVRKAAQSPVFGVARKRFALEFDYDAGRKMLQQQTLDDVVGGILARETRLRNYISEHFPATQFLRLTAHFSSDVSKKFGIKYSPNSDVTPYHGVCVEEDGLWSIRFKKDVDLKNYVLVSKEVNGINCPYFKRK